MIKPLLAVTLALIPAFASAHPGHEIWGFAAGLLHPLSGPEHVIAMVVVGFWAAQLGRKACIVLPAAFMVAAALGALMAVDSTVAGPAMLGPLILTAVVVSRWRPAMSLASLLVGCFAVLHGWSHGVQSLEPAYLCGLVSTSAVLLGLGVLLGTLLERRPLRAT